MEWQPIEIAPKDGSLYLGCWHTKGRGWAFTLGKYHNGFHVFVPGYNKSHATHWMPLPSPPET